MAMQRADVGMYMGTFQKDAKRHGEYEYITETYK